jgi:hypothetical protein
LGTYGTAFANREIDEFRVKNRLLTAEEIQTEYQNQNSPSNFYAREFELMPPSLNTGWKNRIEFTLNGDLINAGGAGLTLTDFPVYLDLSILPKEFFYIVRNNGSDIRITDDSANELARELVFLNKSAQKGELHFKANLNHGTDKVFYIYFGNPRSTEPEADSDYGSEKVWTNNYVLVSHNGGFTDSTQYHNHAISSSGTLSPNQSSLLGYSTRFQGSMTVQSSSSLNLNSKYTLSAWIYPNNGDGIQRTIDKWDDASAGYFLTWTEFGNRKLRSLVEKNDTHWYRDSATQVALAEWSYIVGTYSGSAINTYINGSLTNANYTGSHQGLGTNNLNLKFYASNAFYDEFRISSKDRSSAWLSTEYQNQKNPSKFLKFTSWQGPLSKPKALHFGGF